MSRAKDLLLQGARCVVAGEASKADSLLQEALVLDSDDPMIWCVSGNFALNQRQVDLADQCFAAALERVADDPVARFGQIEATLLRHGYAIEKVAAIARTLDVLPGELVLLSPLIRGDLKAALHILEESAAGDIWKRSGILAICYLVTRHFPLGLGLSPVLAALPKLGLEELLDALFLCHAEELSQHLTARKNAIAVVNSQAKNVYMDYPIFAALRAAGRNVAYFMAETEASLELAKHRLDLDETFLIHGRNLTEYDAALILSTAPDAAEWSPNSVKVLIAHDMSGHPRVADMDDAPFEAIPNYGAFDYYLCANETMLEDLQAFIPENDRALARTGTQPVALPVREQRCLIRSGYPKLDNNLAEFARIRASDARPAILFLPTDFDLYDHGVVPAHGASIVGRLLDRFPDFDVVFRPHPNNLKNRPAELDRLKDEFAENKSFVFDDEPDYMPHWARAVVMVSDFSGGALTFACTTLRPVVFYSPDDEAFVTNTKGGILPFRDSIGTVVKDVEALVSAVGEAIEKGDDWRNRIADFRDRNIFNVGRSADYIAKSVDDMIQGRERDDWVCF